jgi:transcriptional regulator with XRE-family HTH domain
MVASRAGSPSLTRRLGARINALREEAGLTQESVAWACGIPKAHLSRIEHGERLPSIPVLFALAKQIGVEPVDLVGFDLRKPRAALLEAARRGDGEAARLALKRLGLSGT